MSTTLKQELKAWEASFRHEHGRDPTKQDIKLVPDIGAFDILSRLPCDAAHCRTRTARKYKDYNKSKARPPAFATPTKPRPSRHPTSRPDVPAPPFGSPSKSTSNKKKPSTTTTTGREAQYVLANSPSKLQQLAAMHSRSSPNKLQFRSQQEPFASTSNSNNSLPSNMIERNNDTAHKRVAPADHDRSPKKAVNPFASPKKREIVTISPMSRGTTLFQDFERREREKLAHQPKNRRTQAGMGWGHASEPITRSNELDEVDAFFGGGISSSSLTKNRTLDRSTFPSSSASNPFLAPSQAPSTTSTSPRDSTRPLNEDPDDDDEVLGPSPVKRSTSQNPSKPFTPLFDDPLPVPLATTRSNSFSRTDSKPKLFATSLRINHDDPSSAPTLSNLTLKINPISSNANAKNLKRSTSVRTINDANQSTTTTRDDDPDALLEDADDSFYADALDSIESRVNEKGKPGGGKRMRVATTARARGRGRGRGGALDKGKSKAEDDSMKGGDETPTADDDEFRIERNGRGSLVLDLKVQDEHGQETRERIFVHSRQDREGKRPNRSTQTRDGMTLDNNEEGDIEEEEDDHDLVRVSLFDQSRTRAIISSEPARPLSTSNRETIDTTSLPSDLAAILSLRNRSPVKTGATAKERQVAKLLREPTALARTKHRTGLLELQDDEYLNDAHAREPEDHHDEEQVSDDDDCWDDEPDGWKQTGEAMDGYYSDPDAW
ncbi:uncharacterized protein JCM15063_006177 [Sporobolomyces koalae]|uniref:uncharacterized protein n=1 Tax=Sporobolomyces koalae TaxID=500713 RepID=UPI0031802742